MDRKLDCLWEKKSYYKKIEKSETFSHPGFQLSQLICENAKKILDIGCGDGSKLSQLGGESTKRYGIEISSTAIQIGRGKYQKINFKLFDGKVLPFPDNSFDKVTSFFVLEHTYSPQALVREAIRVLEPKGQLIFLAPNFGAPNRCSPNFAGNRMTKLLIGFWHDFWPRPGLNWHKVLPKDTKMNRFTPDLDTTVEPYLGSLVKYLQEQLLQVSSISSFWDMELTHTKSSQKLIRFLGEAKIFPFTLWGPHLFIVARKP